MTSQPEPSVPILLSPPSGSTLTVGQQSTFSWNNTGATKYKFEVWKDDASGNPISGQGQSWDVTSTSTTFSPPSTGNWRWQVRSYRSNGQPGYAPQTNSFVVTDPVGVQLFDLPNYQGESGSYQFSGNDTCISLGSMGNKADSLKFTGGYTGNFRVILYDDANCGTSISEINNNIADFGLTSNLFESMKIVKYDGVQLCEGENYTGECRTFSAGKYMNLADVGWYDRAKSIRFIGGYSSAYHVVLLTEVNLAGDPAHYEGDSPTLDAAHTGHVRSMEIYKIRPSTCDIGTNGIILWFGPDYNRGGGGCVFATGDIPNLEAFNAERNINGIEFVGSYRNTKEIVFYRDPDYRNVCNSYSQDQNIRDCNLSVMSIRIRDFAGPTPIPTEPGTLFSGNVAPQGYLFPTGAGSVVDGSLATTWRGSNPAGPQLNFSWAAPVTIDRVVVWSLIGDNVPVPDGMSLAFSDGTRTGHIDIEALGSRCADITFPERTVTWLQVIPMGNADDYGYRDVEIWASTGEQQSNNVCTTKRPVSPSTAPVTGPPVVATTYPSPTTEPVAALVVSLDPAASSDGQSHGPGNPYIFATDEIYDSVHVEAGAYAMGPPRNGGGGGTLVIQATGEIRIDGVLNMDGQGYRGGAAVVSSELGWQGESYTGAGAKLSSPNGGGGGGGPDDRGGGAGGGYGSPGQGTTTYFNRSVQGGQPYGDTQLSTVYLGSGGGSSGANLGRIGAAGGNGGGAIVLEAETVIVTGSVSANGLAGQSVSIDPGAMQGGGGGSGGSVLLRANVLDIGNGLVTALGGAGGYGIFSGRDVSGGAGGHGRIWIESGVSLTGTTNPLAGQGSYTPPTTLPTVLSTETPTLTGSETPTPTTTPEPGTVPVINVNVLNAQGAGTLYPGAVIELQITLSNDLDRNAGAEMSWSVTDPAGSPISALSLVAYPVEVPPGGMTMSLYRFIPEEAGLGTYVFTGSATSGEFSSALSTLFVIDAAPTPTPTLEPTQTLSATATATPTSTLTPTLTASPGGPFVVDDNVQVVSVTHLRMGPGVVFGITKVLPAGTQGVVLEPPVQEGARSWYRIWIDANRIGWVNAAYLQWVGHGITPEPVTAVPSPTPWPGVFHPWDIVSTMSYQYLRVGAGNTEDPIEILPIGFALTVLSDGVEADGKLWYNVNAGPYGIGWFLGSALEKIGVAPPTPTPTGTWFSPTPTVTPTATPPIFSEGDLVTPTRYQYLRAGPGFSYDTIEILPIGFELFVLDSGEFADGQTWYHVNAGPYGVGWFLGNALEKTGVATPTPTPTGTWATLTPSPSRTATEIVTPIPASTPTPYASQDVVRSTAYLLLRESPGTESMQLALMPYGKPIMIVGGPVYEDGATWYMVDAGLYGTGWVVGQYLRIIGTATATATTDSGVSSSITLTPEPTIAATAIATETTESGVTSSITLTPEPTFTEIGTATTTSEPEVTKTSTPPAAPTEEATEVISTETPTEMVIPVPTPWWEAEYLFDNFDGVTGAWLHSFSEVANVDGNGILRLSPPANGAAEASRAFDGHEIKDDQAMVLRVDLNGETLLGGDASAIYLNQGEWYYASLSGYVVQGVNGWQTITVPFSALRTAGGAQFDASQGYSSLGIRIWSPDQNGVFDIDDIRFVGLALPTATVTATASAIPSPTATMTLAPTDTATAIPTATVTPLPPPTDTPVPIPTDTPIPPPTDTPVPPPTEPPPPTEAPPPTDVPPPPVEEPLATEESG